MWPLIVQEIRQLRSSQKNKILILLWVVVLLALVISHTNSYLAYKEQCAVNVEDIEEDKQRDLEQLEGELSSMGMSEEDIQEILENSGYIYDATILEVEAIEGNNDKKFLASAWTYLKNADALAESFGMYDCKAYGEEKVDSAQKFRDYMYDYYGKLEDESGELWNYHKMTGFNFLYRVMEDAMPLACLAVAMLLVVDSLAGEKESGSIKAKLLLPVSKGKAAVARIAGGTVYSTVMLFLPVLVLFLFLGAVNGFGSGKFLVLEDASGMKMTEAVEGRLEAYDTHEMVSLLDSKDLRISEKYCIGISRFLAEEDCKIEEGVLPLPNERLKFVPVGLFLFKACLYQLAVILLSVSIGNFISLFTSRKGIAVTIGVLVALVFCAVSLPAGLRLINPGTYQRGIGVLGGTAGVTALDAVIFFGISLCLLGIGIRFVQKKQDVIC